MTINSVLLTIPDNGFGGVGKAVGLAGITNLAIEGFWAKTVALLANIIMAIIKQVANSIFKITQK